MTTSNLVDPMVADGMIWCKVQLRADPTEQRVAAWPGSYTTCQRSCMPSVFVKTRPSTFSERIYIWLHACMYLQVFIYTYTNTCVYIYIHKHIYAKEGKQHCHSPAWSPTLPECKRNTALYILYIICNIYACHIT